MNTITVYIPLLDESTGHYWPKLLSRVDEVPAPKGKVWREFTIEDKDISVAQTAEGREARIRCATIIINKALIPIFNALQKSAKFQNAPSNFFSKSYSAYLTLLTRGMKENTSIKYEAAVFDLNGVEAGLQTMVNLFKEIANTRDQGRTQKLLNNPHVTAYSLFVISFMLSEKLREDQPYNNKSWAQASRLDLEVLNEIERCYLEYTGFWKQVHTQRKDKKTQPVVFNTPVRLSLIPPSINRKRATVLAAEMMALLGAQTEDGSDTAGEPKLSVRTTTSSSSANTNANEGVINGIKRVHFGSP